MIKVGVRNDEGWYLSGLFDALFSMKYLVLCFFCFCLSGCFFIALSGPGFWQGPRVSSSDVVRLLESGVMVSGEVYEVEGIISLRSQDRFIVGESVYFDLPGTSQTIHPRPEVGEHVVIIGKVFLDGGSARIADALYNEVNTRRPARRIDLPANQ